MHANLREIWVTFRFPLIVGLLFLIAIIYGHQNITPIRDPDHVSQLSIIIVILLGGFWGFCIPFGFRTLDYILSKMFRGVWYISWFLVLGWWIAKLVISFWFAPIFLLLHIIALIYRIYSGNYSFINN